MATSARLLSISAHRNGGLISRISSSFRGAGATQPQSTALFGGVQRWLSTSYPSHDVVGMPSLSPVRCINIIHKQYVLMENEAG
eukprot:scaffold1521_cov271-Chaetoceros_neogracile.AAC.87